MIKQFCQHCEMHVNVVDGQLECGHNPFDYYDDQGYYGDVYAPLDFDDDAHLGAHPSDFDDFDDYDEDYLYED